MFNLSSRFKNLIDNFRISHVFKSNYLKNDQLLNWILFLLILYGLYLKFYFSLTLLLNSDDVSPGLVCREVFVHGNYFLQGYYFPAPDPHIFTEKIPFHVLPQLLTGYDPKALSLSAYVIFIAVLITYSILIYSMTKRVRNSLIFASLLANIPMSANPFFLQPEIHVGAIFFIGVLLLIYLNSINGRLNIFFYLLILALTTFSDSIIILWYFIPFFATHALLVLLSKPFEMRKLSIPFVSGIIVSLVYLVKEHIPTFDSFHTKLITSSGLFFNHLLLFFKGICQLYNNDLYEFSNTHQLNIRVIIAVIIAIGIIYFVLSNISKEFGQSPAWCLFVFISIIFISIIYVFTTIAVDISTTRYFSFQLILYLSILALIYSQDMKFQKVYIFLLLSLIIINAGSNTEILKRGNEQPNQEQYELINYLEESNLTLGYGDYWDSNLITYLSKEKIVIRPVTFTNAKIIPFRWLACERWFNEQTNIDGNLFVIQNNNQKEAIEDFVHKNPPKKILRSGNYKIYVWEAPELKSEMEYFS